MALVAYDYSDASDVEEDDNSIVVTLSNKQAEPSQPQPIVNNIIKKKEAIPEPTEPSTSGESLFNLLPRPSNTKPQVVEDDDEFLHKKETSNAVKPKAKITVPSLSDFKDVEGSIPSAKPKAANGKKSGLLSMLPQPKNAVSIAITTKSFVPHVLTQKPNTTAKKKPLPSPAKKLKTEVKTLTADYSDDSDNDDVQNDFFSINKTDDTPMEDMPLDIDFKPKASTKVPIKTQQEPRTLQSYFKQDVSDTVGDRTNTSQGGNDYSDQYGNAESSSSGYENNYDGEGSNLNEPVLDDEAIMKLCGARGKRKREDIQIVDVNQKEVLADAREWLLKGLMDDTTKRVSSSKKRGNEPTSQQRRKHQITYLAHQAKANEAELQNQWANNRQTKRQTQSKYGF